MNFVMPDGVEEYPDDILDILNRIPVEWGRWISCDKGWYKLLVDTNRKMNMMWPNYEIHQVKEKFGSLRFYWGISSEDKDWEALDENISNTIYEIMGDIANSAESRSSRICEDCGKFGTTTVLNYWYRTLCPACSVEQGYTKEQEDIQMFFHTVSCTCGWYYGPSKKKIIKDMLSFHKEIHKLEGLANETKDSDSN